MTMTQDQIKNLTATDLLELSYEDIPDAPDFITPVDGIYLCDMKVKSDTYKKKDKEGNETEEEDVKLGMSFEISTVVEFAESKLDEDEAAPKEGDRFSINNYFGAVGVQQFATDTKEVGKAMGLTGPVELLEQAGEQSVKVLIQVTRANRKYKDRQTGEVKVAKNLKIVSLTLHSAE